MGEKYHYLFRQGSLPLIWRDIKIHQNTAYIGADTGSHGIQVVDLTRFRGKTAADFEYIEADFVSPCRLRTVAYAF